MFNKKMLFVICILIFVLNSFIFSSFALMTGRIVNEDGVLKYRDTNDKLVTDSWIKLDNKMYYFDDNGEMALGWKVNKINGKTYFFDNYKNLGNMIAGKNVMIDGYIFHFNLDGTLAMSDSLYNRIAVENGYTADYNGHLYLAGELLRDVSMKKSDYYTDVTKYFDPAFNNFVLSCDPNYNFIVPRKPAETFHVTTERVLPEETVTTAAVETKTPKTMLEVYNIVNSEETYLTGGKQKAIIEK